MADDGGIDSVSLNTRGLEAYKAGELSAARELFTQAARTGSASAMFNLGALLDEEGDSAGAQEWYEQAALAGDGNAMRNLGFVHLDLDDLQEAKRWFARAVEAGSIEAMNNLGAVCTKQGDRQGALSWFERGANAGNPEAMSNFGLLLETQGDVSVATSWYERAAEAGNDNAIRILTQALLLLLEEEGVIAELRSEWQPTVLFDTPESLITAWQELNARDEQQAVNAFGFGAFMDSVLTPLPSVCSQHFREFPPDRVLAGQIMYAVFQSDFEAFHETLIAYFESISEESSLAIEESDTQLTRWWEEESESARRQIWNSAQSLRHDIK